MAHDFLAALKSEIGDVQSQLESNPLFLKLRELQRVLLVYEPSAAPSTTLHTSHTPQPLAAKTTRVRSLTPEREKAVELAREYIADKAGPIKTKEINDFLISKSAELPGDNPQNNLSTLLYRTPEFVSHGRRGWTLAVGENDDLSEPEAAGDDLSGETPAASMSSPGLTNGGTKEAEPSPWVREAGPGGGT